VAQVTLVYPDYTTTRFYSRPQQVRVDRGGWYAEGLAALSATLKQAGHAVSLLHVTQPPTREDFTARLTATHPDVIGFSVRTSAFPSSSSGLAGPRMSFTYPSCGAAIMPRSRPSSA